MPFNIVQWVPCFSPRPFSPALLFLANPCKKIQLAGIGIYLSKHLQWVLNQKLILLYTVSQKNVPPLTCYNLDIHGSITIIFGTSVTEKVGNQNVLYFPTSHNLCFCTTWGNRKPKNCVFSLKCCMLFTKNARITWLQLNHPSMSKRLTGCTRHDLGSSCLLPTCSMLTKSVTMSVAG